MKKISVFFAYLMCSVYLLSSPGSAEEIDKVTRMRQLSMEMKYLDEVLTSSVLSYAFTQDSKWLARYQEHEPKLDKVLKEAQSQQSIIETELIKRINATNIKLVNIEGRAIAMVKKGRGRQALDLLNSESYRIEKENYSRNLESYFASVEKRFIQEVDGPNAAVERQSVANGAWVELTEAEKTWIELNTVKVGVEDFPPVIYVDPGGNPGGLVWDILARVAERTGLKLEVIHDEWSVLLKRLAEKTISLLPATYYTKERATYGLYSKPYFFMREFLYIKKDNNQVHHFDDLAHGTIAIVKNHGSIPILKKRYPQITILETADMMGSISAVLNGKADATFRAQLSLDYFLRANAISGLKAIAQDVLPASGLHFFVRNNAPILNSILQKGLDSLSDEEMKRIQGQWLSLESPDVADGKLLEEEASTTIWWLVGLSIFLVSSMTIGIRATVLKSNEEQLAIHYGSAKFRGIIAGGLSFLAVIILVATFLALRHSKMQDIAGLKINLQGILDSVSTQLTSQADQHRQYLDQLGRDPGLVSLTEKLLIVPRTKSALISSPVQAETRAHFKSLEDRFGKVGFFIIAPDMISLASRRDDNVGTTNIIAERKPELFNQVLRGQTAFIPPIQSDVILQSDQKKVPTTMFFAAPIRASDGKILAILAQRVNPKLALSRILAQARLGKSGESYAFDHEGLLLSESRFEAEIIRLGLIKKNDEAILNLEIRDPGGDLTTGYRPNVSLDQLPLTKMAQSATQGESGSNMDGYRDYRGIRVLGVWLWNKALGIGIATEIDADEAMLSYNITRNTVFGVLGFTLLLAFGATLTTLSLGERATRTLKKSRDELEDKVKARTRELSDSEVRIRSIIDNAADGIITFNNVGIVQSFSPAAEAIFGYSAGDMIGNSINTLQSESITLDAEGVWETHVTGMIHELRGLHKDGTEFPIDMTVGVTQLGQEKMYTCIVRDITERKEAERRLTDALAIVTSSIQYASRIQRAILPHIELLDKAVQEYFILWKPRDVVGGDIYWCQTWGSGMILILADCTGHGVPGAFMTLISNGALERALIDVEVGNVAALIQRMHQFIQSTLSQAYDCVDDNCSDDGLELGACYVPSDKNNIVFAGAGFPLFIVKNDEVSMIKGDRKGIGYRNIPIDMTWTNKVLDVQRGSCFYMSSDGIFDQIGGPKGRGFGKKRFKKLLESIQAAPISEQGDAIYKQLVEYQGEEKRRDDVSAMGFKL